MRGRCVIGSATLLLAAMIYAHPATAQPDSDAIEQFGLFGHWAIACGERPSPYNPHIFVSASDSGSPVRRRATGDPLSEDTIPLLNVRLIGSNQLTMQQAVEGKIVTYLLVMDQDRYRIDEMVTSDGKSLVTHAVQNFDGKASPWYHRCSF
jgi:hypothetical protein